MRRIVHAFIVTQKFLVHSYLLNHNKYSNSQPERQNMTVGKRFAPRPHQVDAITAAVAELAIADRATLVMASGSGKTATGAWVAGELLSTSSSGVIVCLFPSLALIRQTIPVWLDEQPWGVCFRFLAVCSDRSVVDDDIRPDDMPYLTTTQSEEIAKFIRDAGVCVIFATYHSSAAVSTALREAGMRCDLALFDEAHKTAGSPGPAFAGPLSDEVFPCKKRLFMTATPRVTNRKKRNKDGDAHVVSMDDESIYGRVAYRLSFREAAARGLICTYKVLVSTVTTAELGVEPESATVDFHGTRLSLNATANRVALARAIEMVDAKKVITFHSTVAEAQAFVQEGGVGVLMPEFDVYHVNGAQGAESRDEIIGSFASAQRSLISNARCLTEGVDIPAVDLVAFIDPKKSKVDIIQAIGRAMRKPAGSNKEVGYILLPVLIDADSDIEEAMRNADLSAMWDVLSALMDEDEVLDEVIRRAAGAAPSETSGLIDFIEFAGRHVDIDRLRRATEVSIISTLAVPFDFKIGLLRRFAQREGHAFVPWTHEEEGQPLGDFVKMWRAMYAQGVLSVDRQRRLEVIPGWTWRPRDAIFLSKIEVLRSFAEREGHARVSFDHVERGVALGQWVATLRQRHQRLSLEERASLEAIPGWAWHARDEKFLRKIKLLRSFAGEHGHLRIPNDYFRNNINLQKFAARLRADYLSLSEDRKAIVEAIPGWSWTPRNDEFSQGIAALKCFIEREGNIKIQRQHVEGDFKLGVWVRNKRNARSYLQSAQRKELEAIPEWSWSETYDERFDRGIAALKSFISREGHSNIPVRHDEGGFKLHAWVYDIRRAKKKLSPDRVSSLAEIPGWEWKTNVSGVNKASPNP
jgi:superfamily II DNA or RNA helicase